MTTRKPWHIDLLGAALALIIFVVVNYFVVNGAFDKRFGHSEASATINNTHYRSACPNGNPPINWKCEDGSRV